MKKLFILFLPIIGSCQGQGNQFIVDGDLTFASKDPKVYLEYTSYSGTEMITHTDSVSLTDGKFTFAGKIDEPSKATVYCYLVGPSRRKSSLIFFLAQGKTMITAQFGLELATVRGTDEAEEFAGLRQEGKKFDRKKLNLVDSLIVYDANNDKEGIDRLKLVRGNSARQSIMDPGIRF